VLEAEVIAGQVERIRGVCEAFPEVEVRMSDDHPHHAYVVRKKTFAYHLVDHHGDGRVSLECKAEKGLNRALAESDGERFFLPLYMAHHGWVGLYLDTGDVDWDEVEDFLTNAYRLVAPKTLARQV
jgi:predicted DNA-binding protein (MmcQ/YjbR family)